jgi:hypothetical protein
MTVAIEQNYTPAPVNFLQLGPVESHEPKMKAAAPFGTAAP